MSRVLWEIKSGQLIVNLHPGQARAWQSQRRFVAMLAGTQGGKTAFEPIWLYREIQRRGPGDYLAVTATFPLLKLKMLPEFQRFFIHAWHLGEWKASDSCILFRNGTRIIFGSATNPESLESATAKAAVLDEAGQDQFRLESWEAVLRRLSLHQGRAVIGTTLYNLVGSSNRFTTPWRAGDPTSGCAVSQHVEPYSHARIRAGQARAASLEVQLFLPGQYDRPPGSFIAILAMPTAKRAGTRYAHSTFPPSGRATVASISAPSTQLLSGWLTIPGPTCITCTERP